MFRTIKYDFFNNALNTVAGQRDQGKSKGDKLEIQVKKVSVTELKCLSEPCATTQS